MTNEIIKIELESACFDFEPTKEQSSLQSDEIAFYATNHAGERVYMIAKRDALRKLADASN